MPQPNGQLRVIYPDIPDNYRTRVELVWPVYTASRTDALERAARAEATATGSDLAAARLDLRLEVSRAYWALVTARETVRVLEQALATADRSLADVRSRVDAGILRPTMCRAAKRSARAASCCSWKRAAAWRSVSIDLSRLMGLPAPATIEPAEALNSSTALSADAAALETKAPRVPSRTHRPQGAHRWRERAPRRHRQHAQADGELPVWLRRGEPEPAHLPAAGEWQPSFDVSFNVSWQFWDSGRAKADRVEALANQLVLQERQKEVTSQIQADVRRQLVELATSRAALAPARLRPLCRAGNPPCR